MAKISGTLKDNQHSPYKFWADCELKQITEPVVAVGLYIASLLEEIITASNMLWGSHVIWQICSFHPYQKASSETVHIQLRLA